MPTAIGPSTSTLTAPASTSAPANPGRLPVFFFSHGTTAMMGEQSEPAAYWEEVGRRAIQCGVERLVFQGAHWHPDTPDFLVATNPKPPKQPVAWVEPSKYLNFEVDIDVPFSEHIIETLNSQGISAKAAPDFEIIHDTLLILRWMFPKGRSLPMSIISTNGFFDPHKNLAVGTALSHLRDEKCLLIGSGGAVHNLYRLNYTQVIFHKDNFAQEKEPEQWAIDFGQAVTDAIKRYSGPKLRKALVSLMDSPQYRDAHVSISRGEDHRFAEHAFLISSPRLSLSLHLGDRRSLPAHPLLCGRSNGLRARPASTKSRRRRMLGVSALST